MKGVRREYNREYMREYRRNHPEKNREWFKDRADYRADWAREKKYGLARGAYAALLAGQGGGCAVCGAEENLCVDHCHATGAVRGILCRTCNSAAGFMHDSSELAEQLAHYLRG